MAAKTSRLGALHELVAEKLIAQIELEAKSDEGVTPQTLAQAIKFLKDNNINAEEDNPKLEKLKEVSGSVLKFPFDPKAAQGGK
jgi:chromosome segregation and condensation protein ScpB